MPPIRELFFVIMVLMMLAFGSVLFVGGEEKANNLPMNSTIASNYNAITQASALPGGLFGNNTNLYHVVNGSAANVSNVGSSSSSALINSVGLVVGYLNTIPLLYGAVVNFIAIPVEALGVPVGYAQVVVNVMLVGILALAIVSAIFLFPV